MGVELKRAASLILAACALVLLLTWHPNDGAPLWIWESGPGLILQNFTIRWIQPLDFGQKIAGFVLLAAALLVWPKTHD